MLYEDRYGRLWLPEEVEALSEIELEEMEIHVFDREETPIISGLKGCLDCELPTELWRRLTGGISGMTPT